EGTYEGDDLVDLVRRHLVALLHLSPALHDRVADELIRLVLGLLRAQVHDLRVHLLVRLRVALPLVTVAALALVDEDRLSRLEVGGARRAGAARQDETGCDQDGRGTLSPNVHRPSRLNSEAWICPTSACGCTAPSTRPGAPCSYRTARPGRSVVAGS